ncbi:hypothetical protein BD779DRAFT_1552025 [Infundibulicybe gibba]|nr:hypothetical protein BD779DRAFT_1552025 [Infundibulicybe gibba]
MTIASSELIPQPIIVHASTNPFIITIGDVLVAVHGALHTLVTEYEYRLTLLPNVAGWQVGNGYRNGMRRLDLLNGRFWWVGLSASQEGSEMWDLHLQR